jgi:predicted O-linked N-acetylglucosamine transferase (SPINDLY family)
VVTIAELLDRSRELRRAGRMAEAEQALREALAADPAQQDAWLQLGSLHEAAGRLQPAAEAFAEAARLAPRWAEAHHRLGIVAMRCSQPAAAAACFRKVLEIQPQAGTTLLNLALVLDQLGQLNEAIDCCRRGVAQMPNLAEAHVNLGMLLDKNQQLAEAAECYRRALELKPELAAGHFNLGLVCFKQRDVSAAIAHFRRAIELQPNHLDAQRSLATLLDEQGNLDEAVDWCRRIIKAKPDTADVNRRLALLLVRQGKLDEAADSCRAYLALRPADAEAHDTLGFVLAKQGRLDDAAASFRRAIDLDDKFAVAHNHLGAILDKQSRFDEAAAAFQRAVERKPDFAEAYNNRGLARLRMGEVDAAIEDFRRALHLDPALIAANSNLLQVLQYRSGITLAELAAEHRAFDERHARPLREHWRPHENSRDPSQPLRVGFVSGDLGSHPVGYFLVRALEHLDRGQIEVTCYSDRAQSGDLAERLRRAACRWRDVALFDDQRLAEQIRADEIDILVDLAGHTSINRLLVFARKPAPVQMTWMGYVGTTGLTAIDYLIADRYEVPPEADAFTVERVLRLPNGYVCYDPPANAPAVSLSPAVTQGHVTFGSFSNLAKINADVVAVWSRILARVVGSRMLLKYAGLDSPAARQRLTTMFARHDIGPQRIELAGWSPHADALAQYNRVDVALDPFPYGGGLTTCEALWMGVPVVTCPGATFASRHALAHLSNVGFTETIAADFDEYVEIAVKLAADLEHLHALRTALRQQVAASPLCDGARFAANLATLLRAAWRNWCD